MTKRYELIDAGCNFWFNGNDQLRSPFPKEIQPELKKNTTETFMRWVRDFSVEDRESIEDEELVSMFEMFLFSEALRMVENQEDSGDLMITINYPMLPRVGDTMTGDGHGESTIVRREISETEKDEEKHLWITMHLEENSSRAAWSSRSELPT